MSDFLTQEEVDCLLSSIPTEKCKVLSVDNEEEKMNYANKLIQQCLNKLSISLGGYSEKIFLYYLSPNERNPHNFLKIITGHNCFNIIVINCRDLTYNKIDNDKIKIKRFKFSYDEMDDMERIFLKVGYPMLAVRYAVNKPSYEETQNHIRTLILKGNFEDSFKGALKSAKVVI